MYSKDSIQMLLFQWLPRRALAVVFIAPLAASLIYGLGANSKWIGVRELRVRVVGLPVSKLRNARLYECFETEMDVVASKIPATNIHSIDFVIESSTNELISRHEVTGGDYLVDWFDHTTTANYVVLEYDDPLSNQPRRAVIHTPAKSGIVTIDFSPHEL